MFLAISSTGGKRGALLKGPRHADVGRKCMIVHKADSEVNDLADLKRFNGDNIDQSYGISTTIFTADNAKSLIRIETFYDSLHVTPAIRTGQRVTKGECRSAQLARLQARPARPGHLQSHYVQDC